MNATIKSLILTLAISLLSTSSQAIDPVAGAIRKAFLKETRARQRRADRFRNDGVAFFQDAGVQPTQQDLTDYVSTREREYREAQRARRQRLNRENRNPNTGN